MNKMLQNNHLFLLFLHTEILVNHSQEKYFFLIKQLQNFPNPAKHFKLKNIFVEQISYLIYRRKKE